MIYYGTRSKQLTKELIPGKCPHCGALNNVEMHVFQKYAHIYRIPVFPLRKIGVSQCDHCKQVLENKQMPPELFADYERIKSQAKTPVWMFTGVALIAVLIVVALFANDQQNKENAQWISAPHSGDVYEYKTKDNQYTLLIVNNVQGDSVYIRQNEFETNKRKGLSKIKAKGGIAYSQELYAFSRKELKEMLDKKEILDIERE